MHRSEFLGIKTPTDYVKEVIILKGIKPWQKMGHVDICHIGLQAEDTRDATQTGTILQWWKLVLARQQRVPLKTEKQLAAAIMMLSFDQCFYLLSGKYFSRNCLSQNYCAEFWFIKIIAVVMIAGVVTDFEMTFTGNLFKIAWQTVSMFSKFQYLKIGYGPLKKFRWTI